VSDDVWYTTWIVKCGLKADDQATFTWVWGVLAMTLIGELRVELWRGSLPKTDQTSGGYPTKTLDSWSNEVEEVLHPKTLSTPSQLAIQTAIMAGTK